MHDEKSKVKNDWKFMFKVLQNLLKIVDTFCCDVLA
jgi:hypothetical protein